MAGSLPLFPKALLAAWLALDENGDPLGDRCLGSQIYPVHEYDWTTIYADGTSKKVGHAMWPYLCNDPEAGWPDADRAVSGAMRDAAMDALYVGGGSGRYGLHHESLGHSCHHIDTSDDAITLMGLRGASCEKMDGEAMTFADNAYPLVVLATDMFDCVPDPEAMIADAARVASQRVLVAGYTTGDAVEELAGLLEWQGQTDDQTSWARPSSQIVGWIEATGMSIRRVVSFTSPFSNPDGTEGYDEYWLVEAEWA